LELLGKYLKLFVERMDMNITERKKLVLVFPEDKK
jgi:hypothetical protein